MPRLLSLSLSRYLLSFLLLVIFVLHSINWIEVPLVNRANGFFYDLRLNYFLKDQTHPRIVIVDIDEKSLAAEGRWPWSREKVGFLVDMLSDYYAVQLVAFDVVFSEKDQSIHVDQAERLVKRVLQGNLPRQQALASIRQELTQDKQLAEVFRGKAVVLGYFFSHKPRLNNPGQLPDPLALQPSEIPAGLFQAKGFGANRKELQQAAVHAGFINAHYVDADGVLRRVPQLIEYQNKVYVSLPLAIMQLLMNEQHLSLHSHQSDAGKALLEGISISGLDVFPLDSQGAVLTPFIARNQGFTYFSASDILAGKVDVKQLRDKIVLIGTTATGLSDLYTTPVKRLFHGVEVHANILAGMLDNRLKSRPYYGPLLQLAQLLLLGLVLVMVFPRLQPVAMTLLALLVAVFIVTGNFLQWQWLHLDVDLAPMLALLLLTYILQLLLGYWSEVKRRKHIGSLFDQYVSPQLVKQMSESQENFAIGGENREMTVLFSDIRGFTRVSETLSPDQLCSLINGIMTPITREIVFSHQGTIDKYMGDAVMAFWGAPLQQPEHANKAMAAALAIIHILDQQQNRFIEQGLGHLRMGVGVNSGSMVVGNFGSEFRMDYTVMGDSVNLASRLEGLTKSYGVDIIVSGASREMATDFLFRELDQVQVVGKKEIVTIYEPLCLKEAADKDLFLELDMLTEALEHYRARRWDKAESLFRRMVERKAGDRLYGIYLDRIRQFRRNPPRSDWQGVSVHQIKS